MAEDPVVALCERIRRMAPLGQRIEDGDRAARVLLVAWNYVPHRYFPADSDRCRPDCPRCHIHAIVSGHSRLDLILEERDEVTRDAIAALRAMRTERDQARASVDTAECVLASVSARATAAERRAESAERERDEALEDARSMQERLARVLEGQQQVERERDEWKRVADAGLLAVARLDALRAATEGKRVRAYAHDDDQSITLTTDEARGDTILQMPLGHRDRCAVVESIMRINTVQAAVDAALAQEPEGA